MCGKYTLKSNFIAISMLINFLGKLPPFPLFPTEEAIYDYNANTYTFILYLEEKYNKLLCVSCQVYKS